MSIEPFKDLLTCACLALLAFAAKQAIGAFCLLFGGSDD